MTRITLSLLLALISFSGSTNLCMQEAQSKEEVSINKSCALTSCKKENCTSHCSQCKKVYYCSREHQVKDWSTHKPLCKPAESASANSTIVAFAKSAATANKQTTDVEDCIICYNPLSTQEVRLQCNHNNFHAHCLAKWTFNKTKSFCPYCNQPIVYLAPQDNKEHKAQLTDNKVRLVQSDGTTSGQVVQVLGSAKKTWGVEHPWKEARTRNLPISIVYIGSNGPQEGTVYYVRTANGFSNIIHESWVHPADRHKLKNIE